MQQLLHVRFGIGKKFLQKENYYYFRTGKCIFRCCFHKTNCRCRNLYVVQHLSDFNQRIFVIQAKSFTCHLNAKFLLFLILHSTDRRRMCIRGRNVGQYSTISNLKWEIQGTRFKFFHLIDPVIKKKKDQLFQDSNNLSLQLSENKYLRHEHFENIWL